MRYPPAVRKNNIVFASSSDYTGNPKALFLYMIEHGYNKKYKITWLFEKKEDFFEFDIPNVSSVMIWNGRGTRTPEAQKAIMSARYIFYSHNVNWCRKFREEQTFINLWHGCGYKSDMKSDGRVIYYDYLMVTGKRYIDIFRKVLKKEDGNILDLGYPRNEMLFSNRSAGKELLQELKSEAKADKVIIWLPTYRKSRIARLDSNTDQGRTGLPVLYDHNEIAEINDWCCQHKILILLKQHMLASDYDVSFAAYGNIKCIDDSYLLGRNAELYEMMGATDALLTDYSSAATDYMLLDKPIGFTLDDFDRYEEARGWSFENVREYMPGHHIYGVEELKEFIEDIAEERDPHKEWRERITEEMHTYKGDYSKRILDYFGI